MGPDSADRGNNAGFEACRKALKSFQQVSGLGWQVVAGGSKTSSFGKKAVSASSGRAGAAACSLL